MSDEAINKALIKCMEKEKEKNVILNQKPKNQNKSIEPKKERQINWGAIVELIKNPKTNEGAKNYWRKRLYYHDKGFSDSDVEKMAKEN